MSSVSCTHCTVEGNLRRSNSSFIGPIAFGSNTLVQLFHLQTKTESLHCWRYNVASSSYLYGQAELVHLLGSFQSACKATIGQARTVKLAHQQPFESLEYNLNNHQQLDLEEQKACQIDMDMENGLRCQASVLVAAHAWLL